MPEHKIYLPFVRDPTAGHGFTEYIFEPCLPAFIASKNGQQTCSDWLAGRATRISSTKLASIFLPSTQTYGVSFKMMIGQLINPALRKKPSEFGQRIMDRGRSMETEAAGVFERVTGLKTEANGDRSFVHPEYQGISATPDFFVISTDAQTGKPVRRFLLEIKCPSRRPLLKNKYPIQYYVQMQAQLACVGPEFTGVFMMQYIPFRSSTGAGKCFIRFVPRNQLFIDLLLAEADRVYQVVNCVRVALELKGERAMFTLTDADKLIKREKLAIDRKLKNELIELMPRAEFEEFDADIKEEKKTRFADFKRWKAQRDDPDYEEDEDPVPDRCLLRSLLPPVVKKEEDAMQVDEKREDEPVFSVIPPKPLPPNYFARDFPMRKPRPLVIYDCPVDARHCMNTPFALE